MSKIERQKEIIGKLQSQGLRVTKQCEGLVRLLWGVRDDQHLSAEQLFQQARKAGLKLSLSTVYNRLNQWADIGLVLRVCPKQEAGGTIYFDTNIKPHHHFFDQDSERLIDIDREDILVGNLPAPPEGKEISAIEVFIKIKKNQSA